MNKTNVGVLLKGDPQKGITLIALVITIIVLIILAGVSISLIFNENGILNRARQGKQEYEAAQANEQVQLSGVNNYITDILGNTVGTNQGANPGTNTYWTGKVNKPEIAGTGLTPITIADNGAITEVTETTTGWYDYIAQSGATEAGGTSRWANAITKNSSNQTTGMFVWIPRFAYKITSGFHSSTTGTIEVVFLKDKTDKYEIDGVEYTARRLSETGVDTNQDYYVVHPCFTKTEANGIKTYNQGEWDEELTGIWVSKFEGGYAASADNNVTKVDSNITYGTNCASANYYGTTTANSTKIPYPVFLPKTFSYCSITISDIYRINREIGNGNTYYNLANSKVDSHMMKNSEWGAVAYLAQSKYGRNGTEITINNVYYNNVQNVKNGQKTGYGGDSISASYTANTDTNSWETAKGKLASSTGNVYGIYDLSGGSCEYVAGYIENTDGASSINSYGSALIGAEGKYKTIYASQNSASYPSVNYNLNISKRGDAIYETSSTAYNGTSGTEKCSWNMNNSLFSYNKYPFFFRGDHATGMERTGIFAFSRSDGNASISYGFRTILCEK